MIMWITALVLVALCVVIGYRSGAVRAAFTFVGLIIAAILAQPLAPLFAWVFPLIGFKNSVAATFGAPIIAFFVASLIFKIIAGFVHRKVEYYYRYHRHDAERAVWEVMHRRLGACIGAMNGTVYFIVFAIIVNVFGYFTIQTGAGENPSKVISFLGKAAGDLKETRMDEAVASFTPAGEKYMDASDVAGLIYHNRSLVGRLYNYPVFAAMAEEPAFKTLGEDKELQTLIKGQSTLNEILANPKVEEVVSNSDVATRVVNLDFKDLKEYLETGSSPKFAQEKILGHWRYDTLATLQLNKKLKPDVAASVWFRVKSELTERLDDAVFTAFHDNKAKLTLTRNMEGKSTPLIPVRLANGQTNFNPRWFTTNASFSSVGKWSGSAPNYLVTLGNKNGTATSEGKLEDGKLSFAFEGKALSFTRLPE